MHLAFSAGLSATFGRDCLHLRADAPLATLSSALVGGGLTTAQDFCNFYVDRDYAGRAPADDLTEWLGARDIDPAHSVAMMTAVKLDRVAHQNAPLNGLVDGVLALVTAGTGNAVDITAPNQSDPRLVVGTVNIFVWVDAHLTSAALVNACLSVTEAKVQALRDSGVMDTLSGTPATGTSTDCVSVAATQRGEPTPYAGSGTPLGRAIGRAVYRATCRSLLAGKPQ